ncbi:hypothetical protein VP01_723g1, partial [Puccinia sorghi]
QSTTSITTIIYASLNFFSCSEASKTISKDKIQFQFSQQQIIQFCNRCLNNQNHQVPIRKNHQLNQKRVQRSKREPDVPPKSSFLQKPPKGLPLNFYDPNWFNNLLKQQRINVANTWVLRIYWTNSSPKITSINFWLHMTSLMKSITRRRRHQTLRMIPAIELDDNNYENLEKTADSMKCADKDIEYNEDQDQGGGDDEDDQEMACKQR